MKHLVSIKTYVGYIFVWLQLSNRQSQCLSKKIEVWQVFHIKFKSKISNNQGVYISLMTQKVSEREEESIARCSTGGKENCSLQVYI